MENNSEMASASLPPLLTSVLESWKNVKLNDRRAEMDAQAFQFHDYDANSADSRYCDGSRTEMKCLY